MEAKAMLKSKIILLTEELRDMKDIIEDNKQLINTMQHAINRMNKTLSGLRYSYSERVEETFIITGVKDDEEKD